ELDPTTLETVWEYGGDRERPFETETCGSAQRLANGNTLLTESDNGRAIEVTPDGEIVWEWINPHRAGPRNEYIATLFEVIRLPADLAVDWAGPSPR
ncbi:MAG: arylsulfotransferase family protein, partial [Planctomycetota bacterium JB042]